MKKIKDPAERRRHTRTSVKHVIVGVLNIGEPGLIGSIADISLGGVKFTYHEFRTESQRDSIESIDLIADNNYMLDFPCSSAWNKRVETAPGWESNLRQYGIKFGRLTPWQLSILRSIISESSSGGSDSVTPGDREAAG
jgi:c-di-GMP-binding flagellar brake protein YcgR